MSTIESWGSREITIPIGSKITVFGRCKIYDNLAFPNFPTHLKILDELALGKSVTLGTYSTAKNLYISAYEERVIYDVAAVPNINDITVQFAAATATDSATLTTDQIRTRIISGTPTAPANYTLPLGTAMSTAFSEISVNGAIDFSIHNLATVAAYDITVAANTGFTVSGNMIIESNEAGSATNNSGQFRARCTAANTWHLYRLS